MTYPRFKARQAETYAHRGFVGVDNGVVVNVPVVAYTDRVVVGLVGTVKSVNRFCKRK